MLRETIRAFRRFTPGALSIGAWPGRDINVEVVPCGLIVRKVAIGGTSVAESDVVQGPCASPVGEIDLDGPTTPDAITVKVFELSANARTGVGALLRRGFGGVG